MTRKKFRKLVIHYLGDSRKTWQVVHARHTWNLAIIYKNPEELAPNMPTSISYGPEVQPPRKNLMRALRSANSLMSTDLVLGVLVTVGGEVLGGELR